MIAEVIPILRMPPPARAFDFEVPIDLDARVAGAGPGALVLIKWRGKPLFGVVKRVKTASKIPKNKLAPVLRVFHKNAAVTWDLLFVWEHLAREFNMSVSTIAKTTLLPLKKTKLDAMEFDTIPAGAGYADYEGRLDGNLVNKIQYHNYASPHERIETIKKITKCNGQALVIEPTLVSAQEISNALGGVADNVALYTAEIGQKEKFDVWAGVRAGKIKCVVGTKTALFLPFVKLKKIIVDDEANPSHKNWDQAPQYEAGSVAKFRASLLGESTELHFAGFAPSVSAYFEMQKGVLEKAAGGHMLNGARLTIIDKEMERKKGNKDFFSEQSKQILTIAVKGIIFIYLNRKGFARALRCADCGFVLQCGNCGMPFASQNKSKEVACFRCGTHGLRELECPKCGGAEIRDEGFGAERAAEWLKNFAEKNNINAQIEIVAGAVRAVASGAIASEASGQKLRWIVGTAFANQRIDWSEMSHIIIPRFDLDLQMPIYNAAETAYYVLMEFLFKTKISGAKIIVETSLPDHAIFKAIKSGNLSEFYDEELKWRKMFGWPPAKTRVLT